VPNFWLGRRRAPPNPQAHAMPAPFLADTALPALVRGGVAPQPYPCPKRSDAERGGEARRRRRRPMKEPEIDCDGRSTHYSFRRFRRALRGRRAQATALAADGAIRAPASGGRGGTRQIRRPALGGPPALTRRPLPQVCWRAPRMDSSSRFRFAMISALAGSASSVGWSSVTICWSRSMLSRISRISLWAASSVTVVGI
jgi:hypothetical protein